jgi:Ser/Thr protein kinase RdoA (MazF antagonist)
VAKPKKAPAAPRAPVAHRDVKPANVIARDESDDPAFDVLFALREPFA